MAKGDAPKDVNAYQRDYMARRRAGARDIAGIPEVHDPARRIATRESFAEFCRVYFPEQFKLPWSKYHHKAAEKIETAVHYGGLFAFAMPRASGKTTICRWAILWAVLHGFSEYAVLVGATEKGAEKQLRNIKMMLARNPLLLEDFPEAAVPIRQIVEESVLPTKQTCMGERTFIEWQANRIIMPWISLDRPLNSASRGAVIEVLGITSEIRGLNHTRPDNTNIRPGIALADDPQTRESAKSVTQSQTRMETLMGDVAYLAGPDVPISIVCPCTVIYEGDLADQILNREQHPEWQGERTKMVERFPTNVEWWDKYADVLRASIAAGTGMGPATELYLKEREIADAGAVVSWPERFTKGEASAIQYAMNLKIRNEAAFFAECQNEPLIAQDDLELLPADQICKKTMGYARGVVPPDCSVVTAFTDVQQEHLFWMVCAWTPDFTGYILDYGAWPDQKRNYFTRRDIRKKLSQVYTGDENGIMFAALTELGKKLAGQPYETPDGRAITLSRWCIDGGWAVRTPAIEAYTAQSPHRGIITITKGFGIKATQNPFSAAQRAIEGKTTHGHWFWRDKRGAGRWVHFDANIWKKRVHNGLSLSAGSRGSIQLFKAPAQVHRMLADHLLAEKPKRTEAGNRIVYEWTEIPGRDNEGLDNLVGCALGASIEGIVPDTERAKPVAVAAMSLSDYARKAGR